MRIKVEAPAIYFHAMSRYRIGEFASLSGVSAKTLRFYDEIGLMRPAAVDSRTRYRCYEACQLRDLTLILALKNLGVSLGEIRKAMASKGSNQAARRVLQELREKVEFSIEAGRQSLTWIDHALEELTGNEEPVPIVVKQRPAIRVASVRAEVTRYAEIESIEQELLKRLPAEAIGGTHGTLWHRCADSGRPEGEPFVELKKTVAWRTIYTVAELPAITAACAYSTLDDHAADRAYLALRKWMRVRGFRLAGPMREIYLDGMLEIQFPMR